MKSYMSKFSDWYGKNYTNKFVFWGFIITFIGLVITLYMIYPKPEGKKLFLMFANPTNFDMNCLTSSNNDYLKINITVTKLEAIDARIGYWVERVNQINNTCGGNSSFFIYNRQVCYIAIEEGPSAYTNARSCSAFHPPPTDVPLIVQLNDLSNETGTFSRLAYTKDFPACQIVEKIRICPIFENKIWYNQCTDDIPITINYRGC
ncbi:hypothetical protein EPN87_02810 [archaeon]|nr:MAG: hypothetical protein EPN87_02810 [archaeon]